MAISVMQTVVTIHKAMALMAISKLTVHLPFKYVHTDHIVHN